ncbi:MAG: dockerin type I repeat-containing protein [Prevotella sp.]|nr:dockerin type I repeat-containing protein [Prevotella sp.]
MKNSYTTKIALLAVFALSSLSSMAQLNGTGFYRFRNAANTSNYISITNDKFNYQTIIYRACGGLGAMQSSEGKARALECLGKYLSTDIHLVTDANCINPASLIYAQKRNTSSSNYEYNLIGQGTSLLTLTTGTYDATSDLVFEKRYVTIESIEGSGSETLYSAKIEMKSSTHTSQANLGFRYFADYNGKFSISESSSEANAKWYIEPIDHFNVSPDVTFEGAYYTTLYVPFAFKLSGQVQNAYVITNIAEDGSIDYKKIASKGETVPAGTPVILQCKSSSTADCQLIPSGKPLFTAPDSVVNADAPTASTATNYTGTNLLKGDYYCNTDGYVTYTTTTGTRYFIANNYTTRTNTMYVLGLTASKKLGFVKATTTAMPANKAWIEYSGTSELIMSKEVVTTLGDVNRDGQVSIADVTALVNIILGKATEGDSNNYDFDAADVNQDGTRTIADVTALVNIILGKN